MGHAIKEKLDLGWTYSGKNGKRSVKGKNGYAGGGSKKRLKIIENQWWNGACDIKGDGMSMRNGINNGCSNGSLRRENS